MSYRFEVRVLQHKPLGTLLFKIHLDARMGAIAFEVEDDAFAKFAVAHPGSQSYSRMAHSRMASSRMADADRLAQRTADAGP